jgi:hypothetical protein
VPLARSAASIDPTYVRRKQLRTRAGYLAPVT